MKKVQNYNIDIDNINEKMVKMEGMEGSYNKTLYRKYKSILYERAILDYLCSCKRIDTIYYLPDYTEKVNNYEDIEVKEHIENTMNMLGVDAVVSKNGECENVDFKVMNYSRLSSANNFKIYNGNLNDTYGMDKLVVQVEGRNGKPGWGIDSNKITNILYIYVPDTKFLYEINFKKLVKYTKEVVKSEYTNSTNELRTSLCLEFKKGYTSEYCITLDIERLVEFRVIKKIARLDTEHDRIEIGKKITPCVGSTRVIN